MAKSKSKRVKKGKVVKSHKNDRMKAIAVEELKNLVVCNAIDKPDPNEKLKPRTLTYHRGLKKACSVSYQQEWALKKLRWKWDVHLVIITRDEKGIVKLNDVGGVWVKEPIYLEELNEYIVETLSDAFTEMNNEGHALTMAWLATPYDNGEYGFTTEQVLAPLWAYNVLGNMLTAYETDHEDHNVMHYKTDDFADYVEWFKNQEQHQIDRDTLRKVEVTFTRTGVKMKKGDIANLRGMLVLSQSLDKATEVEVESLRAVVPAWDGYKLVAEMNGVQLAKLLTALEHTPECLTCTVTTNGGIFKDNTYVFNGEVQSA